MPQPDQSQKKKMSLVSYKYVEFHPRVNRLARTFDSQGYDVTVFGLSDEPKTFRRDDGIRFVLFPKRFNGRQLVLILAQLPTKLLLSVIGLTILIYCAIRKI